MRVAPPRKRTCGRQLIVAQERDVFDEQARQTLAFARRRSRVSPQLRKIGRNGPAGVQCKAGLVSSRCSRSWRAWPHRRPMSLSAGSHRTLSPHAGRVPHRCGLPGDTPGPLSAAQFRRSEGHTAKTGRLDARALARYLALQPRSVDAQPDGRFVALRELTRFRADLVRDRTAALHGWLRRRRGSYAWRAWGC